MREIKDPNAQEYVLLTEYSDRSLKDPYLLCNFAYKAVFPNGCVSYVGWLPNKGFVGYNGKYKHCFRIEEGDDLSEYNNDDSSAYPTL